MLLFRDSHTRGWVPAFAGIDDVRDDYRGRHCGEGRNPCAAPDIEFAPASRLGRAGSEPQPITVNSTRRSSASLVSSLPARR